MVIKTLLNTLILLFITLTSQLTTAKESTLSNQIKYESGTIQNMLIELYTSEGCSSCPPAERYLNSLKNDKKLWKQWFPIALHVDYWDYIGWKDEFATKKHGQRQSKYASLLRATTVYTPAFMVNGSSWRKGLFNNSLPNDTGIAGKLAVNINNKKLHATYNTKKKPSPLKLNVVVLAMNIVSTIERGENAGRTAEHEFVVVGFSSVVSHQSTENNEINWQTSLPKLHYKKAKKYAVVVWVSETNNPSPLQVVGGKMPGYKP
ncbi:MAG: DUF1223 domain-containing protein [Woeseiaceae bacterium]